MSITVKTDVKVREEDTSNLQDDNMHMMILLNDLQKGISKKRKELQEESTMEIPRALPTPAPGAVTVQTASTSSVDEPKEEEPAEEDAFNEVAYAQAMIAAMSAMGENLSKTIDASSERSLLLKQLADSSIELAQLNLEQNIKDIKEAQKAEKAARKAAKRGSFFSRAIGALSIAAGAFLIATGAGAVAGGMLIATSAAMLAADETGGTEAAIKGIAKGFEDLGMGSTAAAVTASIAFIAGTILVGGGLTAAASKGASAMARGASRASIGFAEAGEAAARASTAASKGVLAGADLVDTAADVAKASREAAAGASKAAQGAVEAADTAKTTAQNALKAVSKASPTQKAALQEVATEAMKNASRAEDAAKTATNAAKAATDAADQLDATAKAFASAAKIDPNKAQRVLVASIDKASSAANRAATSAGGALDAAEAVEKSTTLVKLVMTGDQGAEMAQNAVNANKGIPPKYNTGVSATEMNSALSNSVTRSLFMNLSKVTGPANAAKAIHVIGEVDALTRINQATIVFGAFETGFMTSAAVHMMGAAEARDDAAETQQDKALIMATTDAIETQTARESEFLAMMQKALSDAIGSLKPQLAKQWRPVTNAIQG